MGIKPLGVVVEQEYHLVLNVDFREAFRELDQIPGSRKRVAFTHVNETEEVVNSGSQQCQSVFQNVYVGTTLGRYEECLSPSRFGNKLLLRCPTGVDERSVLPNDRSGFVRVPLR